MATKTTKEKKIKEVAETKDVKKNSLVLGPRVTEKSAVHAERGAYTFNVAENANKSQIKKAIKALYNVVPMKVNITQITKKMVLRRGIIGTKKGGKKAIVYLKKGDKIAFT
jgi:large subunit ribosomal protein L23